MPMPDVTLVDTLPEYLTLVAGSVCTSMGTSASSFTELTADAVTYLNNQLTIDLDGAANNKTLYVRFKTTVNVDTCPDFMTDSTVSIPNTVTLKRPGLNNQDAAYKVSVTNKALSKVATVDNNKISYSININGNGLTLNSCTLTDTLPAGLRLDFDSVELHKSETSTDGTIQTTETTIVSDFKWTYDDATNTFTVTIPDDNGSYILKYECYATVGGTYSNTVTLKGMGFENGLDSAKSDSRLPGGWATASFRTTGGQLKIIKLDSQTPYSPLANVTFELYTKLNDDDTTGTLVDKGTTDSNGTLTFSLLSPAREYWLVETSGASGYDITSATVLASGQATPLENYTCKVTTGTTTEINIFNVRSNIQDTGITLSGTKTLNGKDLTANMFSFVVRDKQNGNIVATGTNKSDGTITFGSIHYTTAGIYDYEISEVSNNINGIAYDDAKYQVQVTVTENNGALNALRTDSSGTIAFTNTYLNATPSVMFTANKALDGMTLADDMFSFVVRDTQNNDIVATGTNKQDGTIVFGEIHYTTAGTYNYTVSEVSGSSKKITYDDTMFQVSVTVENITDVWTVGEPIYSLQGTKMSQITFQNTYVESDTDIKLSGRKILTDSSGTPITTLSNDMFSFIVREASTEGDGAIVSVGTNKSDGTIDFSPIHYTTAGSYYYTVKEVTSDTSGSGITYDTSIFDVRVDVLADAVNGTLTATINIDDSEDIIFINKYDPSKSTPSSFVTLTSNEISVEFDIKKYLEGSNGLADNMFGFIIRDANGYPVSTGLNVGETITFSNIPLYSAGDHRFTIEEVRGNAGGITYDTSILHITVTVETDSSGDLKVTDISSDDEINGEIAFINTYVADSSNIILTGRKNLKNRNGKDLNDMKFNFIVEDATTGDLVSTGTNDKDGIITFGMIHYTDPGIFKYIVSEVKGSANGIDYDDSTFKVTVEVKDENGQLVATAYYDNNVPIRFNNIYREDDISIMLTATKNLLGRTLVDDMFSFTIEDDQGTLVSVGTNNADGTIDFGSIHYTSGGTYTYHMSEVKGDAVGITYDENKYSFDVIVTPDNDGVLQAMLADPSGNIVFNNEYVTDTSDITLPGKKNLTGKAEYSVTVKMVDTKGTLTATATYPDRNIVFNNSYSTSGSNNDSNSDSKNAHRLKTGDESRLYYWFFACFASISLMGMLLWLKRKKKRS